MTINSSVTDAAYHTVHDYPGGAVSLAPRVDIKSPRVLDNKVNDRCESHHLTLKEAVKIVDLSGDLRILDAWEERVGRVAIPLPQLEFVSDTALLETYTNYIKEGGEFAAAFHDALADGKITRAEIENMRKEMHDTFRAGEELLNRAEQLVDD